MLLAFFIFASSHFFVLRKNIGVSILPVLFHYANFKKMAAISISFQASSLLLIFFEPIAKVAISIVGSLELVGYYEMASRLTLFAREIFVRPVMFLSGHFARVTKDRLDVGKEDLEAVFVLSSVMSFLSLLAVSSLILLLSDLWIGERNIFFLYSVFCLTVGWCVSLFAIGPYFYSIGTGNNQPHLISCILISGFTCLGGLAAIIVQNVYIIPAGVGLGLVVGELYKIIRVSLNTGFETFSRLTLPLMVSIIVVVGMGGAIIMVDAIWLSNLELLVRGIMLSCLILLPVMSIAFIWKRQCLLALKTLRGNATN